MLSLGIYPSVIARKGYLAREKCKPEFYNYYCDGLDNNASGFIQGRARCARKWGLSDMDMAKAEISILFTAVTNTLPNVFYMLCYIFASPSLVSLVREEVATIVTRKTIDGIDTISLDISKLSTHCPLLTSCFSETLRLVKTGAAVRVILADVMLNDQYLLKKDSIVQIPSGVMQSDPEIWGPDAAVFNPRRFLAEEKEKLGKEEKKAQNQGYIPFGGGKNLCPGRHLAYNEIASFVALLVYGFEITETDGSVIKVREGCFQKIGESSRRPKDDPEVIIKRREEFGGAVFRFDVGEKAATI
jgi:cytochrome P450